MATKQSLQHRLTAIETQKSGRTSSEQHPALMSRLRLLTFDDLRDYETKTTHVIVARRGVKQLPQMSITQHTSVAPLHVGLFMKDTPNDGLLDLALIGLMYAIYGSRRLNLEELFLKASSSFR